MREDRFEFPAAVVPLREINARTVFEDRSGDVWISGSLQDLGSVIWLEPHGGAYRRLGFENGVLSTRSIQEDREGRLWIGGIIGLGCLATNYLAGDTNLITKGDWLGTYVHRKRSDRWMLDPNGLRHFAGRFAIVYSGGQWSPVGGDLAFRPLSELPPDYHAQAPLPVPNQWTHFDFRAFQNTHDGALWIGGWGGGLTRLSEGRVTTFTTRHDLAFDQIHCLHEDSQGLLWVGTSKGLTRIDLQAHRGRRVPIDPSPVANYPPSMIDWNVFTFTRSHGLPDDAAYQVIEDEAGNLWVGCGEGIYRVARSDLDAVATGRAKTLDCFLLDSSNGLLAGQTTSGYQPSAGRTKDGRLWFATPRGLAAITPTTVLRPSSPPQVFMESLRAGNLVLSLLDAPNGAHTPLNSPLNSIDNPTVPLRAHSTTTSKSSIPGQDLHQRTLRLPPGAGRSIELGFTAVDFTAPKRVNFRYRLYGHDNDWVESGSRRAAYFTNLKPGSYEFRVQAAGRDHRWVEPGVLLGFAVAPYFWETGWFRLSAMSSVLLGGVGYLRWRLARVRRLERAEAAARLSEQRELLARDLHDDLGSKLAQISLLGHAAKGDPAHAMRMADLAREAASNLDGYVWIVHPERDSLEHLAAYLGEVAREFLTPTGLELELDYAVKLPHCPISGSIRKAVLFAVQEALHNVVKHASANRLRLALEVGTHDFIVTVEDDGCGFTTVPEDERNGPMTRCAPQGHGLENMHRRLADVGGRCEIHAWVGGGTQVRLILPFSTPPS